MRVNHILVDYENVQPKDFNLVAHECFRVLVFVGASQKTVCSDTAISLQRLGDRAAYVRTSARGKNALDFRLVYHIGGLAKSDPNARFHIVSKDTDFDSVLMCMRDEGVIAQRWSGLEEIPFVRALAARTPEECARLILERLGKPMANRPGTIAKLSNHIASQFLKTLSDSEVAAVVRGLQATGFLRIAGEKVHYRDATVVPFVSPAPFPEKQNVFAGAEP